MVNFCNFVIASCPRGQTATTFTLCSPPHPLFSSSLSLSLPFFLQIQSIVSAFLSPTRLVPFRFNDDRAHQGYSPLPFPFLTSHILISDGCDASWTEFNPCEESWRAYVIFWLSRERSSFGIFINDNAWIIVIGLENCHRCMYVCIICFSESVERKENKE